MSKTKSAWGAMAMYIGSSLGIAAVILLAVALVGPRACTAPGRSRRALEDEGFEDIETGGYDIWSCGSGDQFHTRYKATRSGRRVSGVVCCGILKGCTVRH